MKKSIAAILVAALATLSMAACGSPAPASQASKAESTAPAESAATSSGAATANATAEKVEIEFFNQKTEHGKLFQKYIDQYVAEHANVTIKLSTPADSEKVLQTRMASNDTPDIFTNWPTRPAFHEVCTSGHVMDISDAPFWDKVDPKIMEGFPLKVDGKMYSIPISVAPTGIFYNVKMFADNGWETPKTLDELYALCDKIVAAGITPFSFADQDVHRVAQSYYIAESSIVPDKFDFYKGLIAGTVKGGENANENRLLQFVLDSRVKYAQKDSLGYTVADCDNYFATEKSAMYISGSWILATVKKANPNIQISAFPFPGVTEADTKVMMGIDCGVSIAAATKSKDTCYDFLTYLENSEFPTDFSAVDGTASCFIGAKNATKEVEVLNKYITEGKWVDWAHVYWPGTVNNIDHRKAIQDYLAHHDTATFWEAVDAVFATARG